MYLHIVAISRTQPAKQRGRGSVSESSESAWSSSFAGPCLQTKNKNTSTRDVSAAQSFCTRTSCRRTHSLVASRDPYSHHPTSIWPPKAGNQVTKRVQRMLAQMGVFASRRTERIRLWQTWKSQKPEISPSDPLFCPRAYYVGSWYSFQRHF